MKRILFISFIISFLIGCSNDEPYNNAMQKGLDYIASEEYSKAESAFELALDEKKGDEKATALLEQTTYYQEVLNAIEDEKWDIVNEKANEIIKIKDGSSALISKAKDAIELSNEIQQDDNLRIDENERDEISKEESKPFKEEANQVKEESKEVNSKGYETYYDDSYGYTIDYPDTFLLGPVQGDPDAIRFRSDEGEILVYGSHHVKTDYGVIYASDDDSIQDLFDYELSVLEESNIQVAYQKIDQDNNWFVLSYNSGEDIIYQKSMASENSFVKLIIVYPKGLQDKYEPILEHVVGSFSF